jgi:hypothetical protein
MARATLGFSRETRTRTRRNPHPCLRVWFSAGMGVGFMKPTGLYSIVCYISMTCHTSQSPHFRVHNNFNNDNTLAITTPQQQQQTINEARERDDEEGEGVGRGSRHICVSSSRYTAMTKYGPNDASGAVWAIGEFFSFSLLIF